MRYNDSEFKPIKSKVQAVPSIKRLSRRKAGKYDQSFEYIFNLILEALSTIDLVTDAYLIYKFSQSEHMAWLCINIQTLIWPFFVSYVPYISYQLNNIRK